MRIGSLFSGVGGLELGLEWAGLGPVLWQVERDPWCRRLLAHHWPDAERFDDVTTATGLHPPDCDLDDDCTCDPRPLDPVDLICGGFPCQDVSSAGARAGLTGTRSGLWWEFARLIGELHPSWVIVENVASGANRWVDPVRRSLAELGYETLPIPLSARDVGAPHRRARVFIVGRGSVDRVAYGRLHGCEGGETEHGSGRALDEQQGRNADRRGQERMAHNHGQSLRLPEQRLPRRRAEDLRDEGRALSGRSGRARGRDAEPVVGGGTDGLPLGLDAASLATARPVRWPARRGEQQHGWEPKRAVPPGAILDRENRLKALGNAVVPQCAEVIGWIVRELEEKGTLT